MIRPCFALALLLLFLAAGCTTAPTYHSPEISAPETWRTASQHPGAEGTNTLADVAWADMYPDPALRELIGQSLSNNLDLRVAIARMDEAAAAYGVQRSALLPALNGSGTISSSRVGNVPPRPGAETDRFDAFGVLSYEVDVWGRIRQLNEAARVRFLAAEETSQVIRTGLVASVASTYFNLRALDRQLEIAQNTLASRTQSLTLTQIKFDEGQGIVSELDVAQAMTQVASTTSSIANIRRLIAITENALSVLLGMPPRSIPRGKPIEEQWHLTDIPAGIPSDVLLRRPDLRAAEKQLRAAHADIEVARAAFFPAISLTGALGLQSDALGDLFESGSRAWNIQPSITAPIFNAGKIRAGVRIAQARQRAALATYEQAILNAFREVDDALASIQRIREQLAADEHVVAAEGRRLEIAVMRYDGGVSSYSDVLDAQRFLFNAELTAVQTRNNLLNASVQLYKALGGGVLLEENPSE